MLPRSANKFGRRPAGFWEPFNVWMRSYMDEADTKPNFGDMAKWYEKNAETSWADADRPSLADTVAHSHSVRTKEDTRVYHKEYRRRSKRLCQEGSSQDTQDLGTSVAQHGSGSGGSRIDGARRPPAVRDRATSKQGQRPRHQPLTASNAASGAGTDEASSDEDPTSCQGDDLPIVCLVSRGKGGASVPQAGRRHAAGEAAATSAAAQPVAEPTPQADASGCQVINDQPGPLPLRLSTRTASVDEEAVVSCAAAKDSGVDGVVNTLALGLGMCINNMPGPCAPGSSHLIAAVDDNVVPSAAISTRTSLFSRRIDGLAPMAAAPRSSVPQIVLQDPEAAAGHKPICRALSIPDATDDAENAPQLRRCEPSMHNGTGGGCDGTSGRARSIGCVLGVTMGAAQQLLRQGDTQQRSQVLPHAAHGEKDKLPSSLPPRPRRQSSTWRSAQPQPLREVKINDKSADGAVGGGQVPYLGAATWSGQAKQIDSNSALLRIARLSADGKASLGSLDPTGLLQRAVCGADSMSEGGLDLSHSSTSSALPVHQQTPSSAGMYASGVDASSAWGGHWLTAAEQQPNRRLSNASLTASCNGSSSSDGGARNRSMSIGSRPLPSWTHDPAKIQQMYGNYGDQYLSYPYGATDWYGAGCAYSYQHPFYNTCAAPEQPPGAWNLPAGYYYAPGLSPAAELPAAKQLPNAGLPPPPPQAYHQALQESEMQFWYGQDWTFTSGTGAGHSCQPSGVANHGQCTAALAGAHMGPAASAAANFSSRCDVPSQAALAGAFADANAYAYPAPHQGYKAYQDDQLDLLYQYHIFSQEPEVVAPDLYSGADPDTAWGVVEEQPDGRSGPVSALQPTVSYGGAGTTEAMEAWKNPLTVPAMRGQPDAWKDGSLDNGPLQEITTEVDAYLLQ